MSAHNPEDLNDENQNLVEGDDGYQETYDEDGNASDETSDDWVDDEQSDAEETKERPAKKKSKAATFIIIAVVVFGMVAFLMFSGGGQQEVVQEGADTQVIEEQVAEVQPLESAPAEAQEAPVVEQPAPVQNTSGMMDDPSVVSGVASQAQEAVVLSGPQAELEKPIEPPPLDTAPPETAKLDVDQPAEVTQVAADNSEKNNGVVDLVSPDIKPVSDFPTADSIKKSETAEIETKPIEAVSGNLNEAPSDAMVNNDAKLIEAQEKLDIAQKRIVDLEKAVADKEAELSEQKLTPPVEDKSEEIESLKSKISNLEKQMELAASSKINNEEIVVETKQEVKEVSNIRPSSKKNNANSLAKLNKTKPAWVLKGANSRTAIIFNKTNSDMKTVSVGDEVAGLGKVLSIFQGSSGWVVKGTNGSVFE
jgi:hypothetical protein